MLFRSPGATGSGAVAALTVRGLRAGAGALAVESLVLVSGAGTERPPAATPARIMIGP